MTLERFVAVRYFRTKRQGLFTLVTTVLGIAGVTIGVAALITTLSVMNGFQSDIQAKVVGAQAHLTVHGELDGPALEAVEGTLLRQPEVVAVSPFALGQAIITFRGRSSGIVLKGLDPEREFKVNELARSLREGSWDALRAGPGGSGPAPRTKEPAAIVLGEELARNLGAWLGDEVVLVSPLGLETPIGLMPKMRRFKVAGLLHTGYYEFDAATAYARISEAASFFGLKGGASGVQARLKDIELSEAVARRMQARLGYGVVVRSYKDMNRTLFAALKLEKYVMFLILTLITLVASFNITSNLVLLGTEKLRDIGLLKAMGATPGQVRRIFLWEGLLFGGCGVAMGLVLGLVLCFYIKHYSPVELPSDIYYLSQVPVRMDPVDVAVVALSGLALSLLSSLYPAWRASSGHPVEAVRDA